MTPDQWSELERISSHIEDLAGRLKYAQGIGNRDRARALVREMIQARADRARLIGQITEHLASG